MTLQGAMWAFFSAASLSMTVFLVVCAVRLCFGWRPHHVPGWLVVLRPAVFAAASFALAVAAMTWLSLSNADPSAQLHATAPPFVFAVTAFMFSTSVSVARALLARRPPNTRE